MLYKLLVYAPVFVIALKAGATQSDGHFEKDDREPVVGVWNGSFESFFQDDGPQEEIFGRSDPSPTFQSEVNGCIEDHQHLITEDVDRGKNVILKCFKSSLVLNVLRYLGEPSKSSIKLFNGLLEFKKIPEKPSCEDGNCEGRRGRNSDAVQSKRNEYARLYRKAMQRLMSERRRTNAYRNRTEEERADRLNRINENSRAFLSEVVRGIGDEDAERAEEEKLRKEVTDPRLLSVLDALSRNYMLRFTFYPGVSARMMRSANGGFTFDLEIQDSDPETEVSSDEGSTREINDGLQRQDFFDDDYYYEGNRFGNRDRDRYDSKKKGKKDKRKRKEKEKRKKAKKLKKILPYLLLPMLIQATLLPFVFKKLFFLAMKALFAGKVALILVGFNLLRNTCIRNDDDYSQKIRVEHYGYRRGEEYGAWINGRAFGDASTDAGSPEPYLGQRPASA